MASTLGRPALRPALLTALLLLPSGRGAPAAEREKVRVLEAGVHSGVRKPDRRVVRSPEEWTRLWREHRPSSDGAPPRVNWEREMVLAVFLGERPTGGYRVEIREVRKEKERLLVTVAETRPDPASLVTQVITAPAHIVAVPRSAARVAWSEAPRGR